MAYKLLQHTQTSMHRWWPRVAKKAWHTNLSSAPQAGYRGRVQGAKRTHKPRDIEGRLVGQNKCTQAPGCRGRPPGTETSEHKTHDIEEVVPNEPRQVHTSPVMQRAQLGLWEKSTQVPTYQALACSVGWDLGKEVLANIPGTSRGMVTVKICW